MFLCTKFHACFYKLTYSAIVGAMVLSRQNTTHIIIFMAIAHAQKCFLEVVLYQKLIRRVSRAYVPSFMLVSTK